MTVERTGADHQTRYELHDDAGRSSVLVYTADPDEPATWKILLPGPNGAEDLYGTQRFLDPDAERLQSWLGPIIGHDRAAEFADAVDAAPPPEAAWKPRSGSLAGGSVSSSRAGGGFRGCVRRSRGWPGQPDGPGPGGAGSWRG
jgi:hypothetical protein